MNRHHGRYHYDAVCDWKCLSFLFIIMILNFGSNSDIQVVVDGFSNRRNNGFVSSRRRIMPGNNNHHDPQKHSLFTSFVRPDAQEIIRNNSKMRYTSLSSLSLSANDDDNNDKNSENDVLFQILLRDLQIEGVPLLEVDGANQVHTMQAAIWTTIAELYDQQQLIDTTSTASTNKVCLIMPDIPISAIQSLVDEVLLMKTTARIVDTIPELDYIHLSLLRKGDIVLGPAIIIEINLTKQRDNTNSPRTATANTIYNAKVMAVMKMFVDRVMNGMNVCPYYNNNSSGAAVEYRVGSQSNDIFHILSSFWNCICEMSSSNDSDDLNCIVLCLPTTTDDDDSITTSISHPRFASITEVTSRIFCLYRGNTIYELLYFHPSYTREDDIDPNNEPSYGHLPPTTWLRGMVQHTNNDNNDTFDDMLSVSNYQRRSPVMAIAIKRITAMDAIMKETPSSTTEVQIVVSLSNNQTDTAAIATAAAGATTTVQVPTNVAMQYVQNTKRLYDIGIDALQSSLDNEMRILNS